MNFLIWNNTPADLAMAAGLALATYLALYLARGIGLRRLGAWAERTETRYDNLLVHVLEGTGKLGMVVLAVWAGAHLLELSPQLRLVLNRVAVATFLVQAALWGDRALRGWLHLYRSGAADPGRATSTAALGFVARIVLWAVLVLMILDNLGVNITTLVASLGIGGVAVALAVQNILGDLFASMSIVLDKPFVIGDFIVVDDIAGTVQYVGLKTTRIRSLTGEQIVYANARLLQSRIHNFKRMEARRVAFQLGVEYGTPPELLRAIPAWIESAVRLRDKVRFGRAHFFRFGPSSLDFEVEYFVDDADYVFHMDTQQAIFLAIYERFTAGGVAFAFPTQTLHLAGAGAAATGPRAAAPPPPDSARP